jgi:DNA-binding transcriptional ArsR family regulator
MKAEPDRQHAEADRYTDERISHVCKALANPVRLQIVRYIHDHPRCIGNQILLNLPGAPKAQSTLSQHIRILCRAGLITAEPDGQATTYTLSPECLKWLRNQLVDLAG